MLGGALGAPASGGIWGWVRQRFVVAVVVFGLFVTTGASAQVIPPGFADGVWDGTLLYVGQAEFEYGFASVGTSGDFDVTVVGGLVQEGSYTAIAVGESFLDLGATAQLSIRSRGDVVGTARTMDLQPVNTHIVGTAEVDGFVSDIDMEVPNGATIRLDITSASCSVVSGEWTQEAEQAVSEAGGTLTVVQGQWVARWRKEAAGVVDEGMQQALGELAEAAAKLIGDISTGSLDQKLLRDVLRRADELALSIPLNADCGIGPTGGFLSVVGSLVEQLLKTVLAIPGDAKDAITPVAWLRATFAGIHAGVLGAGSNSASSESIEAGIAAHLDHLIDLHLEGTKELSLGNLFNIGYAAEALGNAALLARAADAYYSAGGTGAFLEDGG